MLVLALIEEIWIARNLRFNDFEVFCSVQESILFMAMSRHCNHGYNQYNVTRDNNFKLSQIINRKMKRIEFKVTIVYIEYTFV